VVDGRDVETLAQQAVALDQGHGSAGGGYAATAPSSSAPGRFAAVEVYLDPHGRPLAAYQLRFAARRGKIQVVGIENGAAQPFRDQPPYYDHQAVTRGRSDHLILAMFSTQPAAGLPRGKTRVATVHLWIEGDQPPVYDVKLDVAAGPGGHVLPAEVGLHELSPEGTTR